MSVPSSFNIAFPRRDDDVSRLRRGASPPYIYSPPAQTFIDDLRGEFPLVEGQLAACHQG